MTIFSTRESYRGEKGDKLKQDREKSGKEKDSSFYLFINLFISIKLAKKKLLSIGFVFFWGGDTTVHKIALYEYAF